MRIPSSLLIGALLGAALAPPALAQFHLPGIPGGLLNPQRLAVDAAAKRLAPIVSANQPVQLDWSTTYPSQQNLPGAGWHPASHGATMSRINSALAHSTNGVVNLPPGDYSIPIRVYCTAHHLHAAGAREVYQVAPVRGARKDVLVGMYSKVPGARAPFGEVQGLSWSLQAGMRYAELPPGQRTLFDRLVPGMRSKINGSFVDQMRAQWNRFGIVGLPPFDSALGQMGGLGQVIQNAQQARSQILSSAGDFDSLRSQLAPPAAPSRDGPEPPSPWSDVAPNIFMHTSSTGGYGRLFNLQVRVTGSPGQTVAVPLLSQVLYPTYCHNCQPLTYNVDPTEPPKQDGGKGMPG
ncbi:MAG: hypothetical protein NVS1B14_12810 [Vulcanimicrobiaceae bacterium]